MNFNFVNCLYLFSYYYLIKTTNCLLGQYLAEIQLFEKSRIWGCKQIKILRKSPLKVVQIKFLAMHITNQKLCFDIFMVEIL